jgi:cell wall-associated NlpC family hydrolase
MYGKIGIELPRTAAEQALVGEPITRLEQLRKGDRLYFCDKSRHRIDHTGMYMGDGTFIHSSHGKGGVAITPLTRSWLSILVAARR